MVVRRKRKAISIYRLGRLEATAELSEKTGIWEFSTPKSIVEDIERHISGVGPVLETVLEICREMTTQGYGGLFVLGDVPTDLRRKRPRIEVNRQNIGLIGTRTVAEIAKLDGAVFVSKSGFLEAASVIIRNIEQEGGPTADRTSHTSAREGGSRSEAALRTSFESPTAAIICISQNGSIEIFINGKSWPITEAITGVLR